jgi:thiamine-phosphate pyrophosphorylase
MIQLRDKRLDDRQLVARAKRLVELTARSLQRPGGADRHILAIINDRSDIAAAVRADGVHLGQEDLSVKDARTILGTHALIGVSTHNIHQARAAVLDGANYLGAGPTFPSRTKSFDQFAGLEYLREVATEIRLPTFAVGGIVAKNLSDVLATGITRIAVGTSVSAANNPGSAARELLEILNMMPAPCLALDARRRVIT